MQSAHIQNLLIHWHNKRYLTWKKCEDELAKLKALHFSGITLKMTATSKQQRCPWEDQEDELSEAAHDDDNSTMIQQHPQSHQRWDLWISFLCKLCCWMLMSWRESWQSLISIFCASARGSFFEIAEPQDDFLVNRADRHRDISVVNLWQMSPMDESSL